MRINMISGFATPNGTKKFAENSGVNLDNFKDVSLEVGRLKEESRQQSLELGRLEEESRQKDLYIQQLTAKISKG